MIDCIIPGCESKTEERMALCIKHYSQVRRQVRIALWVEFERGTDTAEYKAAVKAAVDAVETAEMENAA